MFFVFMSLLSGIVLGRIFRSATWQHRGQQAVKLLVLALLFTMGLQLGINTELWKALPSIGLTSLLITLGSITGGIGINLLYTPVAKKTKPLIKKSWQEMLQS